MQVGWPMSFAVGLRYLGVPSNSAVIWEISYASTNINPYIVANLQYNTTTGLYAAVELQRFSGPVGAGNFAPSVGTDHVLVGVLGGGRAQIYVDGRRSSTSRVCRCPPRPGPPRRTLCLGSFSGFTTTTPNILVYWSAWWHAALSTGQVLEAQPEPLAGVPRQPLRAAVHGGPAVAAAGLGAAVGVAPVGGLRRPGPLVARARFGQGPPPVPGSVTVVGVGQRSIAATASAATGGASPISVQWQVNWIRGGQGWVNATGAGVDSLSAVIDGLGLRTAYLVRVQYTDSAGNVVYSQPVAATTRG